MPIRMHAYDDGEGLTGLAAFCDTCGEQITEHGYVIWRHDSEQRHVAEWRVIHQGRCEPIQYEEWPYSMPLDAEIIYLANSAGVDIPQAIEHVKTYNMLG